MYGISVLVATVLLIVSGLDYVRRAWIGQTSPVPATWILIQVTLTLSFWMYWNSPEKSWTANIAVTAGLVNASIIFFGVMASHIRHRTLRVAFNKLQAWCLVGGGVIVIFWLISRRPLTSYILVQCIALVAYIGTVKKLWTAKGSSEPLFLWAAVLSASVIAIYPAWVKHDIFSWVYIIRAVPSTSFVIYLISRAKARNVHT
ncbi:hypothetical protein KKH39_01435 [Patescibacteria group bacterium]|nr:hypothetical protein [Patescibacteria group bacterium]